MSNDGCNEGRTRRLSPGTFFRLGACVVATVVVLVIAVTNRPPPVAEVSFLLAGDVVLVTSSHVSLKPRDAVDNYLSRFTTSGDTRFLRYAKEQLSQLPEASLADPKVMLQQARVLSAEHRFVDAATTARLALLRTRDTIAARLLAADSFRRAGRLTDARQECFGIGVAESSQLAKWCAIQLLTSSGEARRAFDMASEMLPETKGLATELRMWTLEITAEAAAQAGLHDDASALYEELMSERSTNFSARLAYSEMLISAQRPGRVLEILDSDLALSSAQVRVLIAQKMMGAEPDVTLLASVESSFVRMSQGGVRDLGARDRALFELYFREDSAAAVRFARANWEQQKGPEDLALLRHAAVAASDAAALNLVISWENDKSTGVST